MTTSNDDSSSPLHRPDPAAVEAAMWTLQCFVDREGDSEGYGETLNWVEAARVCLAALSARDEAGEALIAEVLKKHVLEDVWTSNSRGYHIVAFRCHCHGWGDSRNREGWVAHAAAEIVAALARQLPQGRQQ